ncbi:hypothetical protein [Actinokineospora inagensis]|uniref:hypothetical protein n=1 Tax=Actinokineospora inagensis TaxID=103730 RepID=UPI000426869C|nr:hypothetical protein [Actinokineospora inagensis]
MSLDFQARIRRPLPLAELVVGARRVAADLLGLADVPALALVAGRRRDRGQVVDPGRRLGEDDLGSTLIGPGVPDPLVEVVDEAGTVVVLMPTVAGGGGLVFSPVRRPDAVLTALTMALAAAIARDGRFVDDDLQLAVAVGVEDEDPAALIAATRLGPRSGTLAEATDTYLRQFEHLAGWHLI